MRQALLILSLLGATLFGGTLALSFLNPLLIERAAREIVRIEVERRVGEKIDDLSDSRVGALAQKALRKTEAELAAARRDLAEGVPRRTAAVIANMLQADCECRKKLAQHAERGLLGRIASLEQARAELNGMIESAYASVSASLMREFRIFSGSNAVAFGLLALVTWLRRAAALQLLMPAIVLLGAAGVTAALYLFEQNWLHTIVFGQYWGMAYVVYLAAVAALLADVVFNRARITTRIVNRVLEGIGSATQAVPC
jgi:hypothetical protein